ncbi:MAG: hypothetical protein RBR67_01060 [Desulfobacterium sp.]|jgi:hypothetical protein|nr:hypothetical protein [Desulfobacterium sp.]
MVGKKKDAPVKPGKEKSEKGRKTREQGPDAEVSTKRPLITKRLLKRITLAILAIALLAGAGLTGYSLLTKENTGRKYVKKELPHVTLPPEMLKFCFDNLTDIYDALQKFSLEITRLDREIQRIESIGAAYPDQAAIADREKKIWSSVRKRSLDSFTKIEQQIRQIYVTFKINPEAGRSRLNQERTELVEQTTDPLETLMALTGRIKTDEQPPLGFIKKVIYKIKNLFS